MQLSLFTSCATDLLVVPEPTRGAAYSYTDLRGADLSGASLTFANFDLSDLRGALLAGAALSGANFYRAELSGTDLSGANFSGANLRDAVLTGANLTGTNLTDVDRSHVDLCDANLEEAVVDEGTNTTKGMVCPGIVGARPLSDPAVAFWQLCWLVHRTCAVEADVYVSDPWWSLKWRTLTK